MRVIDLDRDMSDVFPTGTSLDSDFLFDRMERATFEALGAAERGRVVDVASGVGQDDRALARRGAWVAGVEPSKRMSELAVIADAGDRDVPPGSTVRLRAWSEALPFAAEQFDGSFCKGALDHFDDPEACVREMARVTRRDGRVVLAVANFDSLAVRLSRARDRSLERLGLRRSGHGRRHHDVPSDHFTRYEPELLREQLERFVTVEQTVGVSLLWGVRSWARLLAALPAGLASRLLHAADRVARRYPGLADVLVIAGRPRRGE
jgi:SAM-dependent methyltransferase